MSIEVKVLTLGNVATNCYIIGDTQTHEAIVIDPVDEAPKIMQAAEESEWEIKLILATHGHFDHVLASQPLKDMTGVPFYIHRNSTVWLESLPQQGMMFYGKPFPEAAKPDRFLADASETIELAAIRLETLFTPGHAPGHVCFLLREHNLLFCGDTIFAGSIGRTDLPYCDYDTLMESITQKILPLGDAVRLLPGHGPATTIGQERRTNPFILDYMR